MSTAASAEPARRRHHGRTAAPGRAWSVAGGLVGPPPSVARRRGSRRRPGRAHHPPARARATRPSPSTSGWPRSRSCTGDNINYSTSSRSSASTSSPRAGGLRGERDRLQHRSGQLHADGSAYQYMPDVAGATCLMYNLNGQAASDHILELDRASCYGIFSGRTDVEQPGDPGQLNPRLSGALPRPRSSSCTGPMPPARTTSSRTTSTRCCPARGTPSPGTLHTPGGPRRRLADPQAGGTRSVPTTSELDRPERSDNASNYVACTNGTITYVETAYAIEHHKPCAYVENACGTFVAPSEQGDAVALTHDQLAADLEQTLTGVFTAPEANAYPISAYSYFITQASTAGDPQPTRPGRRDGTVHQIRGVPGTGHGGHARLLAHPPQPGGRRLRGDPPAQRGGRPRPDHGGQLPQPVHHRRGSSSWERPYHRPGGRRGRRRREKVRDPALAAVRAQPGRAPGDRPQEPDRGARAGRLRPMPRQPPQPRRQPQPQPPLPPRTAPAPRRPPARACCHRARVARSPGSPSTTRRTICSGCRVRRSRSCSGRSSSRQPSLWRQRWPGSGDDDASGGPRQVRLAPVGPSCEPSVERGS